MIKLEDWAVVLAPISPYQAPETASKSLAGIVTDHPEFETGAHITSSAIRGKRDGRVITKSGSEYFLGKPAKAYEELYPDAYNRLMNSLPEL